MKYIITNKGKVKTFPENVSHSRMGTKMNVKSAGYFNVVNGQVVVSGSSHSLGIPSFVLS